MKHTKDKKFVRCSQFGIAKGKSCLTNQKAFYNEMTSPVGEETAVDIAYLNFSKALDSVSRNILMNKLTQAR